MIVLCFVYKTVSAGTSVHISEMYKVINLIQGPDGYPRKVKLADNGDGTFKATYIPDDCGRYKVSVKYGGKEVPHSPFQVQAFATGSVSYNLVFHDENSSVTCNVACTC